MTSQTPNQSTIPPARSPQQTTAQPPNKPQSLQTNPQKNTLNVNKLGYPIDIWADLIEDMGHKSEEVHSKYLEQIKSREMPDVVISEKTGFVSTLSSERRKYTILQTSPGITAKVIIAKYGKDLFVSWQTFTKWIPNSTTIILVLLVAFTFGACAFVGSLSRIEFSYFEASDFFFAVTSALATIIIALIIETLSVAFAGWFIKGYFLGYFLQELTVFDVEDIAAMSLSLHTVLLRVLDNAGIDVTKLRLKQHFKSGRRGEEL